MGDAARGESGGLGSIASGSEARRPYSNQRSWLRVQRADGGVASGLLLFTSTPQSIRLAAYCQLPGRGAFNSLSLACGSTAPSKREPFGAPLTKSCPRWRGKWHGEAMTKGERLNQPKSPSYSPSVGSRRQLPRKRWRLLVRLTSSDIKPALKGEVAASATSRRRGCIGAALVCVNPSVNPPCGVLPAPRPGSLLV